jgi:photosystem II stability/assembly factor-like uncharacterized protein
MSQWFSQPLPVSGQVIDLKFLDANTGLISMNSAITLRTTNGGYNWSTKLPGQYIGNFEMIDSNTVYALGETSSAYGMFLRSYNRGATWDSLPIANSVTVNGISFVNKDTGWVSGTANAYPYIWRTTNAGVTWTVQTGDVGYGRVFFLKNKVNGEYIGWARDNGSYALWKTTNSGVNWTQILNSFSMAEILFIDQFTGYASYDNKFKKSTNGGLNWTENILPSDPSFFLNTISRFQLINKDTIYGDDGIRMFGTTIRGIIWRSTNGGVNWGYQQPDTSIHSGQYHCIAFINKDTGWSVGNTNLCIRTNNGGGPIIYPTYIESNSTIIPTEYILKQNYPNPFNPSTTIEFSLPKESYVKLKILDLSGKTVLWVVYDMLLYSGLHKFKIEEFSRLNLSSGIYFYQMEARDINSGKLNFTQSRKMILLK